MDVEMVDDAGNKLQLASGQPAILTFTIPDTLLSLAPASIPLWYFNDSSGRWIQQGTAVKQGNTYVGQVGHFTYWNCDAPMGTVNFKVHVVDQSRQSAGISVYSIQCQWLRDPRRVYGFHWLCAGADPSKAVEMQMQVLSRLRWLYRRRQCGTGAGGPGSGDGDGQYRPRES